MVPFLLTALLLLDMILLVVVYWISRKQLDQTAALSELDEERRLLDSARSQVQADLAEFQSRSREMLDRMTKLAFEAEQEVSAGKEALIADLAAVAQELAQKFDGPTGQITKAKAGVDAVLKKVEHEKLLLRNMLLRSEQLCQFFRDQVPYEEVLHEIEDKKYADALKLLGKGVSAAKIASDLGIQEAEVLAISRMGSMAGSRETTKSPQKVLPVPRRAADALRRE